MSDYKRTGDKTPPTEQEIRASLLASGRNYVPTNYKVPAPSPIAAVARETMILKPAIARPLKPDQKV